MFFGSFECLDCVIIVLPLMVLVYGGLRDRVNIYGAQVLLGDVVYARHVTRRCRISATF